MHCLDLDVLLAPSGKEQDAAKKKQLRQDLAAGPLSVWFGNLEKQLSGTGSGYFVGDKLTVADLAVYCRLQSFKGAKYDDIPADIVSRYAALDAFFGRMEALPKIAEWNKMAH